MAAPVVAVSDDVNDDLDVDDREDVDHALLEQEEAQLAELEAVAVADERRPPDHPTEFRNKRHGAVRRNPSYVNKCAFLVNVFY